MRGKVAAIRVGVVKVVLGGRRAADDDDRLRDAGGGRAGSRQCAVCLRRARIDLTVSGAPGAQG